MFRGFLTALFLLAGVSPLAAQTPSPLRIELNRLEAREGACRVWMVLNNGGGGEALDPLRLDLVIFGKDGVVSRRLAVDAGPLPAGRTVVRLFDLTGQGCDTVGSVLLNDILACGSQEADARNACVGRAALASRVSGVNFEK
ncbi:Tat pathway signal protein [Roseococcus sp. SYP-B2431]|uniref:Tat pathway signal protein n=1 Tax=Roseococcus sp. SYP-B2431 TaxID=2496640 RepID=UPI00103C8092|nr:Tat pathway signal protein [Roseococcus sp. SYP-B2431]TCH99439.1 Tat pathway signal protein [Roseococcus sp. SYP-B2431]